MCPNYVEKCCTLEPEKGEVAEPLPVYFCKGLKPDSHLECPVFKTKAAEEKKD
ncbi:MAG: hypothetical protein V1748_01755 [Actinomycetota bacterium]